MTVGGPGRLLPAGGGEDGRFPEGAPGVQQEQLQQIPCGFRLQGFQPPALGVFAHQRIPLGTDYRDREDEHPPALPPPAVGQKECGQEAGAGAGRAGGRELRPAPENRPDRQPRHDRGHLKIREIREFPRLFPLFSPLTPPPSPPPFLPLPPPPSPKRSDFPGSALFIWDSPLSRFFFLYLCRGNLDGEGKFGILRGKKKKIPFPKFRFFSGIAGICSLESLWDNSGLFLKFLLFFWFFWDIPEFLIPSIPFFLGLLGSPP